MTEGTPAEIVTNPLGPSPILGLFLRFSAGLKPLELRNFNLTTPRNQHS